VFNLYLNLSGSNIRYLSSVSKSNFNECFNLNCVSRGKNVLKINDTYVFTTLGPLSSVNYTKKYLSLNCTLTVHNEKYEKLDDFLFIQNNEFKKTNEKDGVGVISFSPNELLIEIRIFLSNEYFEKYSEKLKSNKISKYVFRIKSESFKSYEIADENQEITYDDIMDQTYWRIHNNNHQLLVTEFDLNLRENEEIDEFQDFGKKVISIDEIHNEIHQIKIILFSISIIFILIIIFNIVKF